MRFALVAVLAVLCAACVADNAQQIVDSPVPPAPCPEGPALGEVFGVWQLLSRHELRLNEADLRGLAQDPATVLMYLYEREDIARSTRLRAMDALSFVPDDRVADYLRKHMVHGAEDEDARHKAIVGFARAFPDLALTEVGTLLALDVDPQIRLTAASALATFCGEDGRILVLQAAGVEGEQWVKDKMRAYGADNEDPMAPREGKPAPTFP